MQITQLRLCAFLYRFYCSNLLSKIDCVQIIICSIMYFIVYEFFIMWVIVYQILFPCTNFHYVSSLFYYTFYYTQIIIGSIMHFLLYGFSIVQIIIYTIVYFIIYSIVCSIIFSIICFIIYSIVCSIVYL